MGGGQPRGVGARGIWEEEEEGGDFKFVVFCCIFVNSSLSLFQGFIFMSFILISSFNVRFYSHLISFSSIYAM